MSTQKAVAFHQLERDGLAWAAAERAHGAKQKLIFAQVLIATQMEHVHTRVVLDEREEAIKPTRLGAKK